MSTSAQAPQKLNGVTPDAIDVSLPIQLGLAHQLVVESQNLGQIEVAAPSDNIDTDGPDEESLPGFAVVLFHAPLLSVESTPGDVATATD